MEQANVCVCFLCVFFSSQSKSLEVRRGEMFVSLTKYSYIDKC